MNWLASFKIYYAHFAIYSCSLFFSNHVFALESKIGVLLSLTGSQAYYGKETKNGIEIALSEYLKKNPNSKIKFIFEDSQSSPTEAAKGANKLLTSDKVPIIIGDMVSSNTIAASSIIEKAKIPMISPGSTNDTVTKNKKYVFRTCFTDSFQGLVMANFALQNLKTKTAVILQDIDSDYSIGLSNNFAEKYIQDGGKILKIIKYSQKDTSFTPQLGEIRKLKPEVIFIPGFHQQVGIILREAKDLQIKAKFLGGDGWDTKELRTIANGAEVGSYISSHYSPELPSDLLKKFINAYKEKFKVEPSAFSALGYDTAQIVFYALEKSKNNSTEELTKAISNLKNFPGVTGTISIDQNNNAIKPAVILEYTQTGYRYITNINPVNK